MPPRLAVEWSDDRLRGWVRIFLDDVGFHTPLVRFDTRWWKLDRSLQRAVTRAMHLLDKHRSRNVLFKKLKQQEAELAQRVAQMDEPLIKAVRAVTT